VDKYSDACFAIQIIIKLTKQFRNACNLVLSLPANNDFPKHKSESLDYPSMQANATSFNTA